MEKTGFINQYLNKNKLIQQIVLDYLDNENDQTNLLKISSYYENEKIREDKNEFHRFIKMIAIISKNHYHSADFYQKKIEQIINLIKNDIPQNMSNTEIFNIFKNNIRILLFLLNEKICFLDEKIVKILRKKYSVYFYPEIKQFESEKFDLNDDCNESNHYHSFYDELEENDESNDDLSYYDFMDYTLKREYEESDKSDDYLDSYFTYSNQKSELMEFDNDLNEKDFENINRKRKIQKDDDIFGHDIETFNQKRLIGENDNELCQLIRNDNIDEFISYVNQNEIEITQKIKLSDFETNSFLLKNHPTIIEYATFFGSIQIFKYLIVNKCKIKPSIWMYSVHGMNPEIIHILEEKRIKPPNETFLDCLYESIKCHHNDFSNYLSDNYIPNIDNKSNEIIQLCMKKYNFVAMSYLFESKLSDFRFLNQIGFIIICLYYNHINLVQFLLKQDENDINQRTIIITENQEKRIENDTPLIHIASDQNNDELLKIIISNPKVDVNQISKTKSIKKEKIKKSNNQMNFGFPNFHNQMNLHRQLQEDSDDDDINKEIREIVEYTKEDTVLNMALKKGNVEIVKLLLAKQNINPNLKTIIVKNSEYRKDENIEIALNIALEKEYYDIARILLSIKGIDVNLSSTIDGKKKTPLSISVEKNNMELVKELISINEIDINQPIQCTNICYHQSYKKCYYHYNDDDEFDMFYDDDDDDYYYGSHKMQTQTQTQTQIKNILYIAIERNELDIVKILLARKDIDVNLLTNEGLHYGFDCESNQETPLFLAVSKNNLEIVQMLLSHQNIDVNKKSIMHSSYIEKYQRVNNIGRIKTEKTALYLAVECGYIEIVKLLLNVKGININEKFYYSEKTKKEETILHVAIENSQIEIVRLLLKRKGIDVNAKKVESISGDFNQVTSSQKTALYMSVESGKTKIVELLLKRKDLKINEKSYYTRKGYTKYIEFVVNYEGDKDVLPVEEEDYIEEKTVLQAAINKRNKDIVTLLLSHSGINVNEKITTKNTINDLEHRKKTQSMTSTTALHVAVQSKHVEIIQLLLNHNRINANITDSNYKKPIDLAKDKEIIRLFKK